jgi:hypothetical protein
MKNYVNILFLFLVGILVFSCTSSSLTDGSIITKRRYNKGWHVNLSHHRSENLTTGFGFERSMAPELRDSSTNNVAPVSDLESVENSSNKKSTIENDSLNTVPSNAAINYNNLASIASANAEITDSLENKCDTIVFKDGKRILAKVQTIDKNKICYKLCNNPDGPDFSHETSLIEKLQFPNGTVTKIGDYYTFDEKEKVEQEIEEVAGKNKKVEGFSLASLSLFGLSFILLLSPAWILILLTLPLALAFGIAGLIRFKQNAKRYKARWVGYAGTVLSSIGVVALLVILLFVVLFSGFWY